MALPNSSSAFSRYHCCRSLLFHFGLQKTPNFTRTGEATIRRLYDITKNTISRQQHHRHHLGVRQVLLAARTHTQVVPLMEEDPILVVVFLAENNRPFSQVMRFLGIG